MLLDGWMGGWMGGGTDLASAHASSKLVRNATLKIYPGGPHGLADTHKNELNADLMEWFVK